MQTRASYHFKGEDAVESPALIYYEDTVRVNIKKAIELAGGAARLWPHVKTHKSEAVVRIQLENGIHRFKCATIAEAEMCARAGAPLVLLAYPLAGPSIGRFIRLRECFNFTEFMAIGDDLEQLGLLGAAALETGRAARTLIDVNIGMDRTGVPLCALESFALEASKIPGIAVEGLHCYDGHLGIQDPAKRKAAAAAIDKRVFEICAALKAQGLEFQTLVMGGTPTFPCRTELDGVYLSPGTFFVQDWGYRSKFPDIDFDCAAAVLTRVVSHPAPDLFTVDTGYKAIASDQAERGIIADLPDAKSVMHSEEHWVWRLSGKLPPIGTVLYILPAHICPTSALYPSVPVVSNGKLAGIWNIDACRRRITV